MACLNFASRNFLGLIALALGLNIALLIVTRPDEEQTSVISGLAHDLANVEAKREEQLLSLHFDLEQSYDAFNESGARSDTLAPALRERLASITRTRERETLESFYEPVGRLLARRRELATQFATENASYANSKRYFLTIVREAGRLFDRATNQVGHLALDAFARETVDATVSGSTAEWAQADGAFLDWTRAAADADLKEALRLTHAHGLLLIETKPRLDAIMREFIETHLEVPISVLLESQRVFLSRRSAVQSRLKWSLYALSATLVLASIVLYRRTRELSGTLQHLNRDLERKVQLRTIELSRRNEELQKEMERRRHLQADRDRIFTASLDLLAIVGLDGRFLQVNPAFELLLGFRADELIGEMCLKVVHPDSHAVVAEKLQGLALGLPNRDVLMLCQAKNGNQRWMVWNASPVVEAGVFYACGRDVTDQKRAEDELRDREESFRALTRNAPDAVERFDRSLRFVYVNPAAERAIQRKTCEILGQTREALCLPAVPAWNSALRRVFETGEPEVIEFEEEAMGGSRFFEARLAPEVDVSGAVRFVLAVSREVTSLRCAIAEARAASERFDLAVRGSNDGIWDWNLRTGEVFFSARFKELLGYGAEDFPKDYASWRTRVHADDGAAVERAIHEHLRSEATLDVEFRICTQQAEWRWFRARGHAVREGAGVPLRMAGSLSDITESRQKSEALRLAKEAAELANRAKSEFLATMSHEIRTPMNGILGFAELLLESPLTEMQQDFATTIKSSGEALTVILNDVLDFSKIEAGKLDLENLPFDPERAAREVVNLMAVKANAKGLELSMDYAPKLEGPFFGDVARFRQVLMNLIGNAVKFTDAGHVRVRLEGQAGLVTDSIRVSVSDTGLGISPTQQARLFQKFSQADSSTTRKFGGTGLGLAICKRLVELMHGRIGVDSEPDRGSTFWFVIPSAAIAGADRSALPVAATRSRTPGCPVRNVRGEILRVLLAEDTLTNQRLAQALLSRLGIECDIAANGAEAVELFRERRYDAVLMDCQMPELDGFGATREIRIIESGRAGVAGSGSPARTPIIAVTANALAGDRERCLAAGMDDYLTKPMRVDGLKSVLARWLAPKDLAA